jgi:hypothetical protein
MHRESLGTASSGIGTVNCGWHNMKRPLGVGDLQKEERQVEFAGMTTSPADVWSHRYINMDYMFFMSLAHSPLLQPYVLYNIACQWHKNLSDRMKLFNSEIQFKDGEKFIVFLVPRSTFLPTSSCAISSFLSI